METLEAEGAVRMKKRRTLRSEPWEAPEFMGEHRKRSQQLRLRSEEKSRAEGENGFAEHLQ